MSIDIFDTLASRLTAIELELIASAKAARAKAEVLLTAIDRVKDARASIAMGGLSEAAEYLALQELNAAEDALMAIFLHPDYAATLREDLKATSALIEAGA